MVLYVIVIGGRVMATPALPPVPWISRLLGPLAVIKAAVLFAVKIGSESCRAVSPKGHDSAVA